MKLIMGPNRHEAMRKAAKKSIASLAFAQLLWIWGAGLGISLASFHMNAVLFYVMVMVIVVILLDGEWRWMQAVGAALVAMVVIIS